MKWILLSTLFIAHGLVAGKLYDPDGLEVRKKTIHAANRAHFRCQTHRKKLRKDECVRLLEQLREALQGMYDDIRDCDSPTFKEELCKISNKLQKYEVTLEQELLELR
jgi:hypothetical protein